MGSYVSQLLQLIVTVETETKIRRKSVEVNVGER